MPNPSNRTLATYVKARQQLADQPNHPNVRMLRAYAEAVEAMYPGVHAMLPAELDLRTVIEVVLLDRALSQEA